MEQRHCVDRTPVSEAQAFETDALDERDLEAAATKLLTKPAATSFIGDAIETHHTAAAAAKVAMEDARSSVSPAVMAAAIEAWNAYAAVWKADKEWAEEKITEEAWISSTSARTKLWTGCRWSRVRRGSIWPASAWS